MSNYTLGLILSKRLPGLNWNSFSVQEWNQLLHKAQDEKIGPLMYWALSHTNEYSGYPKDFKVALRQSYVQTWIHNQLLIKEYTTLSESLYQAHIPVVALKGICYILTLYPDIGLRPMADIDILVPVMKFLGAVQIARGHHYVEEIPEKAPGITFLISREISMYKETNQLIKLDLHHGLVSEALSHPSLMDWFWLQTEVSDRLVQTLYKDSLFLTPTAQILLGIQHTVLGHNGMGSSLLSFYELDQLIRFYNQRLDWDLLLSKSEMFGWKSALKDALGKTIDLFDSPVPILVKEDLSKYPDPPKKLIYRKPTFVDAPELEEFRRFYSLKGNVRVRFLLATVIPSQGYMRWRYNIHATWQLPFFYFYRWWSMLKELFRVSRVFARK